MEPRFRYCLNTGTVRGHHLPLPRIVDLAADAGYNGIEPWIGEIEAVPAADLKGLASHIRDRGLAVEGAIGFAEWIVDDPARRARGLEQMKRDMDLVARIGGTRIAAPAAGATDTAVMSLMAIADRYRAVLELGDQTGVTPLIEVWGFSKTLTRLGDAAYAAVECGHPHASVLADVYHLYKGGSGYGGLRQLNGAAIQVFHMNDFPAEPRETITDAHRVFPGDGVAPLRSIVGDLAAAGFRGVLSLELFNEGYYKQEAAVVARTGLEKMKAVARAATA